MAIHAIGAVTGLQRDNSSPGNFIASIQYSVIGETGFPEHTHDVYNVDPSMGAALIQSAIQSAMKTYLSGLGVTFGMLDTFQLIPGIA